MLSSGKGLLGLPVGGEVQGAVVGSVVRIFVGAMVGTVDGSTLGAIEGGDGGLTQRQLGPDCPPDATTSHASPTAVHAGLHVLQRHPMFVQVGLLVGGEVQGAVVGRMLVVGVDVDKTETAPSMKNVALKFI